MNLPPIDKDLLAKMDITPVTGAVSIPSAGLGINYGIQIPPREPKASKAITYDEAQALFGISESVKMNFVPQMLIAVALDEAVKFINYCREHRISEYKKYNRLIKQYIEEYAAELQQAYGPAFCAYSMYVDRYFEFVAVDRLKMWYSIGNIVNQQLSRERDRDAATYIAIIHNLILYAEKWDENMDKVISAKLGSPVHRKQNKYVLFIMVICMELEETWGLQIKTDRMIDMNMAVLANRASRMAEAVISEEANVSKC